MNTLLASLLVVAAAAEPIEAPLPVEVVARRHGEAYVASRPHVALVIGVTTPAGREIWGFGRIERGDSKSVPDGDTLYEIGSITKSFTGTLLADLALDETVTLDDPVRKYLPDDWSMPARDGREISLLQLSTHTSSLPRLPPGFTAHMLLTFSPHDPYSRFGPEDLRIALEQIELKRPIGNRVEYSNLGVGLLGFALARADGAESIDALFEQRILTPLELCDTTFNPTEEQLSRLAPPFNELGLPAASWHFDCLKACGGLRSTANDLLTYAEAAIGRRDSRLSPAFELAMQPFRQTEGERATGLGWFVRPMPVPRGEPPCRLVWHGGGTGGYRTFLGLLPERGAAIVVLANSAEGVDPDLTWPVMKAILRH